MAGNETDWTRLQPLEPLPMECLKTASRGLLQTLIRQRAQPLYLGNGRVLSKTLGRYRAFYDPEDLGFAGHVMVDGFWEFWLTQFILRRVEPGMHVLDIGANFGYYTLLMSDLVGEQGRGWAFEPNPHTASYLRSSVELNGFRRRTEVVEAALSDAAAPAAHFFVPDREPKNARLVPAGTVANNGRIIEVPVTTADDVVGDKRIDFVKIDAEGAEYPIYRGMARIIERWRPRMIIEFNALRGDAPAFLDAMIADYGRLRYLETDAELYDVDGARLLTDRKGTDWLLFLGED